MRTKQRKSALFSFIEEWNIQRETICAKLQDNNLSQIHRVKLLDELAEVERKIGLAEHFDEVQRT